MTSRTPVSKDSSILIIGAGVFGLSTALELKQRGYQKVTIVDRYLPPVIDGSSVDISRVIRTDYADSIYGRMAREAHASWLADYKDSYYQSGFVILAAHDNKYANAIVDVNKQLGVKIEEYDNPTDVKSIYPNIQARMSGLRAYHNPLGGWADAEASIRELSMRCSLAGVSFVTGKRGTVQALQYDSGDKTRVTGAMVAEGPAILADQVIVATGAWTNRLVSLEHATSASGQPVGFIQLTPDEAKQLENTPVIINLQTGMFCFPPTPGTTILKVARHGYGYATDVPVGYEDRNTSSPKRDGNNVDASYLPEDAEQALRDGLRQLLPDFANHEWMNRRLCWYSDTPDGDFVIDHHPRIKGLFLATGGAGHAFKFLPVLGRYITDCYENKASDEIRKKWRVRLAVPNEGKVKIGDGSRGGPPLRTLTTSEQARL